MVGSGSLLQWSVLVSPLLQSLSLCSAPYTLKADVWSYGVTAWEVFSKAEIPYADIPVNHLVIDAIRRGERLKAPKGCPARVFALMASCWQVKLDDRPSFARLVELLKRERPLF